MYIYSTSFLAAMEKVEEEQKEISSVNHAEQLIEFPAAYFDRYQPNTALDMVLQVPGFQLNTGTSSRGFVGVVSNILINDKYPTIKQATASEILARISANNVERIELIRGRVRDIDLQGQSVAANIVLSDSSERVVNWKSLLRYSTAGPVKPGLSISVSDQIGLTEYIFGIEVEREANGQNGTEKIYDGDLNLVETRHDELEQTGLRVLGLNLNASTFLLDTLFQLNGKFNVKNGPLKRTSRRNLHLEGVQQESFFNNSRNIPIFELGVDAERRLNDDLISKAILLYTYKEENLMNLQRNSDSNGLETLLRVADSEILTEEGVSRLEVSWTGLSDHIIHFNMEGAYNSVESSRIQNATIDGLTQIENIPGANTTVEELRGDFLLKDTWLLESLEFDYGLGVEVSRISQTGDAEQTRNFIFLKPQGVLTIFSRAQQQTRIKMAREVSQLNFNDFISTAVFEDGVLALGNPDLRPETTWVFELEHERRTGKDNVFSAAVFYHRLSDVEDLLPITPDFEVPGNIGQGLRWGIKLRSTIALDRLGISNAKIDFNARWQDSSVTDPVTGESRQLSANPGFGGSTSIPLASENEYVFDIAFRHDLKSGQIAWGWDIAQQARRPLYKVNELDVYNEGLELNAFIETNRWFGMKIRLDGTNLLNWTESRTRTIYSGERDITSVQSYISTQRVVGRRLQLTLTGNF